MYSDQAKIATKFLSWRTNSEYIPVLRDGRSAQTRPEDCFFDPGSAQPFRSTKAVPEASPKVTLHDYFN